MNKGELVAALYAKTDMTKSKTAPKDKPKPRNKKKAAKN